MATHTHHWVVEQQSSHRFCDMCGRHDPPDPRCADRPSALWAMLSSAPVHLRSRAHGRFQPVPMPGLRKVSVE